MNLIHSGLASIYNFMKEYIFTYVCVHVFVCVCVCVCVCLKNLPSLSFSSASDRTRKVYFISQSESQVTQAQTLEAASCGGGAGITL